MTPYEEMAEAAKAARQKWSDRNDDARQFLTTFFIEFAKFCGTPNGHIKFLAWDEAQQVFGGEPIDFCMGWQALEYIEKDDEWKIGVVLRLNPHNHFPANNVTCGMFVTEKDGRWSVRVGRTKPEPLDLQFQEQRDSFFKSMVAQVKESLRTGNREQSVAGYGFKFEAS